MQHVEPGLELASLAPSISVPDPTTVSRRADPPAVGAHRSAPRAGHPAAAFFCSCGERTPKRFCFSQKDQLYAICATPGSNLIQYKTHNHGPTVGPQVRAACQPSRRRVLLWFRRPTACPPRAPRSAPHATHPAAALFFSSDGPPRAHSPAPRAAHPAAAFSSLVRRGPQTFPVWGNILIGT